MMKLKLWMKALIGVVALLILAVIVIPLFVNANTFRPMLEKQLASALGRPVQLGDLSLSLLRGELVAKDISIAEDPAYGTTPFIQASSLQVGVEMKPLIFDRALRVTGLTIDAPKIHIVHGAKGSFNFSSLGKNASSPQAVAQKDPSLPDLKVAEMKIKDGVATVDSLPSDGPSRVYEKVNLTVQNFSFDSQFPFTLSANLPGGGDVSAKGNVGPISKTDASNSPLDADLKVNNFDPVAAGVVPKDQGFSTLADVTAHATSDGRTLTSNGTIHASKLQLVKGGTPMPKPVDVTYNVVHDLGSRNGQVKDLFLKTGSVGAHANGTYAMTQAATTVDVKISAPSLPIDEVVSLLPSMGVHLPSNSALKGGTITASLGVKGPVTALVITGPVQVDNTRLAGFNLGSKMSGLGALAGVKTGDATEIRQVRFNLTYTNAGIRTDNLFALLPALGQATGAGSVASSGALSYKLLVKPAVDQGVGGAALSGLSMVSGGAGGAASSIAKNGIPLSITGTTSNPVFTADMKGVTSSLIQDQATSLLSGKIPKSSTNSNQNTVNAISGLLGGKKK
jgi:AsmA protein